MDKSQYDFSGSHFDDYLTGKLLYNGMDEVFDDNLLQITHVDSRKCQGVHAADFLTGRVFRKYRDDNSDDYNTYFKEKTIVALDFFNGRIKKRDPSFTCPIHHPAASFFQRGLTH